MSDAPTLYDQDDATIERVLNEERMAAMRSFIAELENRIREQRDLLDECEQIFAEFAKAGGSGYAFRSREMLAKLRGD